VSIYHGHPVQAAGESYSPVGHCVYREVVPERGRGAGVFQLRGILSLGCFFFVIMRYLFLDTTNLMQR